MKLIDKINLDAAIELDKYSESRQEYVDRMEAEGYSVFYPEDNELLLDIDSKESYGIFSSHIVRFMDELETDIEYEIFESKTPDHVHVSVLMPFAVDPYQRILYQLLLGSDPIRELLSTFRLWRNDPCPTLLVRKES